MTHLIVWMRALSGINYLFIGSRIQRANTETCLSREVARVYYKAVRQLIRFYNLEKLDGTRVSP